MKRVDMSSSGKSKHSYIYIYICVIIVALLTVLAVFGGRYVYNRARAVYHNLCDRIDVVTESVALSNEKIDAVIAAQNKGDAYEFSYDWTEESPLIAHAFGAVDGITYTNSREAFLYNYSLGHRIFEVDFDLSTEGVLILSHDAGHWRSETGLEDTVACTYETYKKTPLYEKYTSLDYQELVQLMIEYPDIYIITDTKYSDETTVYLQFAQIVKYATAADPAILDRIIPQIYCEDMLDWVMDVYPFRSVIYTLYADPNWTADSVYSFCQRTGVRYITIHYPVVTPGLLEEWEPLGIIVGAHTNNDLAETQSLFDMGVDMMYTDYLTPDQFEG